MQNYSLGVTPAPQNISYGYTQLPTYSRTETENQSSSVAADYTRGVFCITRYKQTSQGKLKQVTKDVCPFFDVREAMNVSVYGTATPPALLVQYIVQGTTYCDYIPAHDAASKKYHKHMRGLHKFPEASYTDLNAVIDWAIITCPIRTTIILYDRQGFFQASDGKLQFAQAPVFPGMPPELVPEGLRKRRSFPIDPLRDNEAQIVAQFFQLCSQSLATKFAGLYLTASLFLPFFPQEMTRELAILNLVVPDNVFAEKLTALLCTNDLTRHAVPELGMKAGKLESELNQVYDGVAVVVDRCFVDETSTVQEGTKAIIRSQKTGRKLIVSISDKVGSVADRLEEGCCFSVPIEAGLTAWDVQTIYAISAQYEAVLIRLILRKQMQIQSDIQETLASTDNMLTETLPVAIKNTLRVLTCVAVTCHHLLGSDLMTSTEITDYWGTLSQSTDQNRNLDTLIRDEFARILSEMIRTNTCKLLLKKHFMTVNTDEQPVIVYGKRLFLPQDLMTEICSAMHIVKSRRSLINALKRGDVLNATDGNTHPIDAYDVAGKRIRLYCYDISASILDADVSELIENPDAAKFFIKPEQLPDKDFLHLISRADGSVAGRQLRYSASTNNSIAIWGQSGYGKTYLMTQLIMRTAMLGHQVVVFDSSDSFSLEALCHTLPRGFIDSHILVYDLDSLEIPVDAFHIDRSKSQESQESMLFGLIFAGLKDLSSPQSNLLRSAVEGVLAVLNPDEPIRPEDICAMLDEKSPAYRGLTSRLERLFHIIDRKGMAERTWKEFFTRDITIIRIDPSFTERGNALFDVLMASLYNAQCEDSEMALTVCVDELQQQNLAKGSAIHKILTEGRKKHMGFYGATQDYYPRNTDLGAVMGKADTQIFLRPTLNSGELVAKELRLNKAEREKLDSLMRGECFIKGSLYNPDTGRNESAIISGNITPL